MDPENNDDAAENWVVLFQTDPTDAVAQLVTFVLRLSGCAATVDQAVLGDTTNAAERVAEIQDDFAQNVPAQYPVVSRSKALRHVRRSASVLVDRLIHDTAEADIAAHDDFLPVLQVWLGAFAASPLRAFRHTATVVVLWLIKGLSDLREQIQSELGVAERQQQAEESRTHVNETRLAHIRQKIDSLDDVREFVDTQMDELVHK